MGGKEQKQLQWRRIGSQQLMMVWARGRSVWVPLFILMKTEGNTRRCCVAVVDCCKL
jgi:hypothetical protein